MGNDGGSIPTRRELVKEAARNPTTTELKETQNEAQEWAWTTDPLSHKPLAQPVVSDCAGRLYNKDAVLEFLLPAAHDEAQAAKADKAALLEGRVSSLRDVVEVRFKEDREGGERDGRGGRWQRWVCPVTGKTLGPGLKSVYLVPCGHAFSEVAIKEMGKDRTCVECGEPYEPDNVVPILTISETEKERLDKRIKRLREQGLTHSLKKAPGAGKKRKKDKVAAEEAAATTIADGVGSKGASKAGTPQPVMNGSGASTPTVSTNGIKNAATASLTAKVLEEQEERNKRRKMAGNENLQSLFHKGGAGITDRKTQDFMSRGFSIPANAKHS